jgi:hypothetical protein
MRRVFIGLVHCPSMSAHAYTEDQLVEQPAIGLFAELGWSTVSAMEETFGAAGTLQRETKGEVVLAPRLRAALAKSNPALPAEAIATAMDELVRDRSAMTLEAANRGVYRLLKEGIKVSVPDREAGGHRPAPSSSSPSRTCWIPGSRAPSTNRSTNASARLYSSIFSRATPSAMPGYIRQQPADLPVEHITTTARWNASASNLPDFQQSRSFA